MSSSNSIQLGLLAIITSQLVGVGCGGKEDYEIATPELTGGGASTGGAAGCPSQPIGYATSNEAPPAKWQCGWYTQQVIIAGKGANLLESFNVGGASDASACVYPAPTSVSLVVLNSNLGYADPNNMSVWFSQSDGSAEMFPNVNSYAGCTDSVGGWYSVDTPPSIITFCPCTCDRLNSIEGTLYVVDFPIECPE
jgi:hypothetical protein